MPDPFLIEPGTACDLEQIPSRVETDLYNKSSAYKKMAANAEAMAELSRNLYAENQRSILLILQGMDASGKDSTIRTVTRGMNARSLVVTSFKVPSEEELDHDFLWRIHRRTRPPVGARR